MSNKYFGGVVENKGVTEPVDEDMKSFVLGIPAKVSAKMDKLRVADAMTEVFSLFKRLNKYIDETMPWALAKEEDKQDRLATVLYNLVEGITTVSYTHLDVYKRQMEGFPSFQQSVVEIAFAIRRFRPRAMHSGETPNRSFVSFVPSMMIRRSTGSWLIRHG